MYKHVNVSNPLHLDQLYILFIDNQYHLKKMIVDIYSLLPANILYEKIYLNLTNQYNGYIISLSIDYTSPDDMYKISIFNVFTNGYVIVNNDLHSMCCAINDIKYNKVPYGQPINQFPCVQPVHYKL